MHKKLFFLLMIVLPGILGAQGTSSGGVDRKMLIAEMLSNVPEHVLTAVTIALDPETRVEAHSHEGFVYVYVLEGTVRSQIDGEDIIEYNAGESWVEPPGVIHTLTHNPSTTHKATILAVFVAREGARLTTSGELEK